jgi:hydrogenase maturation protein HypF
VIRLTPRSVIWFKSEVAGGLMAGGSGAAKLSHEAMLTTREHPGTTGHVQRRRWLIRGRVQGVGFRPFIYRLARAHELSGGVWNDGTGVVVEAQGAPEQLMQFAADIRAKKPPLAVIREMVASSLDPREHETAFSIDQSQAATAAPASAEISPDLAVCPKCLAELRDPHDSRRHGYPLINCTECGPRFSIVRKVPYDRANTTMAAFAMCDACRAEYGDPADRRFHAQPTACRVCGPEIVLIDRSGQRLRAAPVDDAVRRLLDGEIIAIKGLGGFHLAVRADQEAAVARLRANKHRLHKPFALMVPNLEAARRLVDLGEAAAAAVHAAASAGLRHDRRPLSRAGHDQRQRRRRAAGLHRRRGGLPARTEVRRDPAASAADRAPGG